MYQEGGNKSDPSEKDRRSEMYDRSTANTTTTTTSSSSSTTNLQIHTTTRNILVGSLEGHY